MSHVLFRRERGVGRRLSRLAAGAGIIALLWPGGAFAMQATPAAAPVSMLPSALEHNLAAMVLSAGAFPVEGLAFLGGQLLGPAQAALAAPAIGKDPAEVHAELAELGMRGRYIGYVATPSTASPRAYAIMGATYVSEYADGAGAVAGFALLEEETGEASEDIDAPVVGDESERTRTEEKDITAGSTQVTFDYTFRTGNVVAGLGLTWYEGEPGPERAAQRADAAEAMLERIEAPSPRRPTPAPWATVPARAAIASGYRSARTSCGWGSIRRLASRPTCSSISWTSR